MRAGRLRHRITIQSVGSTYDDYGDLSDSWSTLATVWAGIKPLTGKEENIAEELSGVITHSIVVRYRTGVTANNRIQFGSRVFQIESLRNWDERNIFLELLAKEVTT